MESVSSKKYLKWSDDLMFRFMDLYQSHPCLWDYKKDVYKNKSARDTAINNIIIEMGIVELTPADVKNKIKTIRTMYKKELALINKSKKSGAGTADIYEPRLLWFRRADTFLRTVSFARKSTSSLVTTADYLSIK